MPQFRWHRYRVLINYLLLPHFRSHILQSDSAELMSMWIAALHKSIDAAIQYNRCDQLRLDTLSDSLPGAGQTKKM